MTLVTKEKNVSNKTRSTLSTTGLYRPGTGTVNKTSTESQRRLTLDTVALPSPNACHGDNHQGA